MLIRDPYQYSDAMIIIPPQLVQVLDYFDGERTDQDLRAALFQITGDLQVGELQARLIEALDSSGFVENERYEAMRDETHKMFAESPQRLPAHAGAAYPVDRNEFAETMMRYLGDNKPANDGLIGIAAPHVSPEGGWLSYRSAYSGLSESYKDRIFVVLGTSHHGEPDRFGLTRKSWVTPWGEARPAFSLIDELAGKAPGAVLMEDYCMAIEHSVEFQVIFLQYLFGAEITVLPVLCGAFAKSLYLGEGMPEDDENVARFFDALGELGAREGKKLFWVLGVDMAHMGRRYHDQFEAQENVGQMAVVAARDRARIDSINAGDARGFWDQVKENHDDLKWCGSPPFYTFLKTMPQARGTLENYEQWNIDPQSVVSFAAMKFR